MQNVNIGQNYKVLSQKQGSILAKSFLVTGISFLLISLIGYGFGVLFSKCVYEWHYTQIVSSLYIISILLVFISIFGSVTAMRNLFTQKTSKIAFWIILYSIGQGIGCGMLFSLFTEDSYSMILIFGVCGAMFVLCALVGYLLNMRAAFGLAKLLRYGWGAMMFLMLLMFIPMTVMLVSGTTMWGFQWYYWLILGLSALLFMGYISYDVWMITNTAQFLNIDNSRAEINLVLYFGYKLLVDLMGLLWTVATIFARFGRR